MGDSSIVVNRKLLQYMTLASYKSLEIGHVKNKKNKIK